MDAAENNTLMIISQLEMVLVRPLTAYEKPAHSPKIRFYLEDGNHRALVYAVFLRLHAETYQPVRVIFSEDWTHLYPWAQLTA